MYSETINEGYNGETDIADWVIEPDSSLHYVPEEYVS